MRFLLLLILLLAVVVVSCGTVAGAAYKGKVVVSGNDPHTFLILVGDGATWEIVGPLKEKLWNGYQGQVVEVTGVVVKEAVGPGYPAQLRVDRILRVVK